MRVYYSMVHIVVDTVAVRPGSSAVIVENLLQAWQQMEPTDRLTVLAGPEGPYFDVPAGVAIEKLPSRFPGPLGGLWLRSFSVRRAASDLGADAVLAGVPASGLAGAPCRRGVILCDLRHELRPEQFARGTRLARRVSWWWSLRKADGIYTISERTLNDLQDRHPRFASKGIATPIGSDHVEGWPKVERADPPYALAFGHFANKNADSVVAGWARFCETDDRWRLRLVGMGQADRESAAGLVRELGIEERVDLMPWLDDDAFADCFARAGLVIFPSDFEGFGLPAAEAQRLGIPVVISPDPALAEVTGGHAAIARSVAADDLAAAMQTAIGFTSDQLEAGREHAQQFTWHRCAEAVRASLLTTS